jgi:HD-GYP domain-containing protein (c-di-GMP phosphodiesterase class II)
MSRLVGYFAGWKIRNILFLLLLLSGIVPLAISSLLMVRQNAEILETQEKGYLARSALFLSVELNDYLVESRRNLEQLGRLAGSLPTGGSAAGDVEAVLRNEWLQGYLEVYLSEGPGWLALRALDSSGSGTYAMAGDLDPLVTQALNRTYQDALVEQESGWRLVVLRETNRPLAVVVAPFTLPGSEEPLFLQGAFEVEPIQTLFRQEAQDDLAVFLVDEQGGMLWFVGADEITADAVASSELVGDFADFPLNLTAEYSVEVDGKASRLLARISPVDEAGWGVVMHKPVATAFRAVEKMVLNTAISSAVVILLALVVAGLAARHIGHPISSLAESTKEIAAGNFTKQIEISGPGVEIGELAEDFSRMGGELQRKIQQLERAAQANRELFIGSMRAFVAAVDAKDPYTRGHSERVAAHSRTISMYLGLSADAQHRVWVGALLHDVGKIGIEDSILRKGGVLSAEEYDQMKLHPVIGAEILSRIEQLREMIPAIRWHHEAWNGQGYPDGRRGEQIPLMARIVAVADTFDAITTSRPYQRAYEVEFALETIRKLAGTRFDAKVVTAFLRAVEAGEVQLRRDPAPTKAAEPEAEATVAT